MSEKPSENRQHDFKEDEFLRRTQNNTELAVRLVRIFLDEQQGCQASLASIQDAIAKKDAPLLTKAAHRFKGMVSYLSEEARTHAFKLEQMGRAEDFSDVSEAFNRLTDACERLVNALHHFLESVNPSI